MLVVPVAVHTIAAPHRTGGAAQVAQSSVGLNKPVKLRTASLQLAKRSHSVSIGTIVYRRRGLMIFKTGLTSLLIIVGSTYSTLAQQCNVVDFKGKVTYKKDVMTNLSYIDQIASRLDKGDAESLNIGFLDIER